VLGAGIGLGWLLTWILPFTLFEGSVLGLITAVIVGFVWLNILGSAPIDPDELDLYDDDEFEEDYNEIPEGRFYKNFEDQTWESWFRYQIANSIYVEFQDSPRPIGQMGDKQLQELAVRLTDIAVVMCKRKPVNTKRFKVTTSSIKKEMFTMGQRPYDDDILELATTAINDELDYNESLQEIIRSKLWSGHSDMFEEVE
jgi:hypothetical protein